MTDVLWPPDIAPANQEWRILGNVGAFQSPLNGATRTVGRPGARWGCRITVPPLNGANRARIMAVLGALRDRSARIWMPDFSVTQRGSFPATELLTNNDFSNGTTGWSVAGTDTVHTVLDRVSKAAIGVNTGSATSRGIGQSSVAATQYAAYAARAMFATGSGPLSGSYFVRAGSSLGASDYGSLASQTDGMKTLAFCSLDTTFNPYYGVIAGAGMLGSDFFLNSYASAARCILVDNGPNALTYSDQIDNAAWSLDNAAVTANSIASPDGTTTGDTLYENTATSSHSAYQTKTVASTAADYAMSAYVKQGARNWVIISIGENTGGTAASAWFNLATGAIGTVSTGANWSNTRAFISSAGNGWYRCHVVSRKTNAATSLQARIYIASADGVGSYLGTSVGLYVWRAVFAQSSVPTIGAQTTSAATIGTAQTGTSIYAKGLPASTSGILRAGDPFSLNGQRNVATASLDSDAAGLGVLQCAIPVRSPADNDPIIINTPMSKMMLATDEVGWDTLPGQFSGFTLDLVEDIT